MDLMATFVRNVSFPLWTWKDGDGTLFRYLHRFDDIDGCSVEQLRARQAQRLHEMLRHAYAGTDYYRGLFDRSGGPPRRDALAELRRLPILTKDDVRKNLARMIARPRDQLLEARTGGSTGKPMMFYRDKESVYLRRAQERYFDRWMGYRVGEKVALFVAPSHHDDVGARWRASVRNATCERALRFDPWHITDAYLARFTGRFARFRPSMIKCFPNSLAVFCDFVARRGLVQEPVRAISCTGENVYAHQRERFVQVFGGEVFEKYGTRECGVIACECRVHRGLHVFTDGVFLEILDDADDPVAPGKIGRVVLTDLFNKAMPLLRYEIGDMAEAADETSCECGSPLPRLARLLGRERDVLYDGEGNPKPGYLFVEALHDLNLDAQFQIVQSAADVVQVRVVRQSVSDGELAHLRACYQGILGPGVEVRLEQVDAIERDPSGKYSYVKSMLNGATRVASDARVGVA